MFHLNDRNGSQSLIYPLFLYWVYFLKTMYLTISFFSLSLSTAIFVSYVIFVHRRCRSSHCRRRPSIFVSSVDVRSSSFCHFSFLSFSHKLFLFLYLPLPPSSTTSLSLRLSLSNHANGWGGFWCGDDKVQKVFSGERWVLDNGENSGHWFCSSAQLWNAKL